MKLSDLNKALKLWHARTEVAEAVSRISTPGHEPRGYVGWLDGYLVTMDMPATRAKLLEVHTETLDAIDRELAALSVVIDQTPAEMLAADRDDDEPETPM